MTPKRPKPISAAALAKREHRVAAIARGMGFIGRIEYRHVYSQTGGAQYGLAHDVKDDLLTVYAEAFDKDSDPGEFSLEAMIAHERGHQMIARHERLKRVRPAQWSEAAEEIFASLVGSLLVDSTSDEEPASESDVRLRETRERPRCGSGAFRRDSRSTEEHPMIGKQSPAEMQRYLRSKLAMTDAELAESFNQKIEEAEQGHPDSPIAGDTLRLLRDALLRETKRKPRAKAKKRQKCDTVLYSESSDGS